MLKVFLVVIWMLLLGNFAGAQHLLKNGDDNWIQEYPDGSFRTLNLEIEGDFLLLERFLMSEASYNFLPNAEDNFYYIKAFILAEKFKATMASAQFRYDQAQKNCLLLEDELNQVKQENGKKEVDLVLSRQADSAKVLSRTKNELDFIAGQCSDLNNLLNFSPEKRKRLLRKKYKVQFEQPAVLESTQHEPQPGNVKAEDEAVSETTQSLRQSQKVSKVAMPLFVHVDLALMPPFKPYKVVFDGVDSFTKNQRKELEKDILFSFTDENLKSFNKNRDFIVCQANLTRYPGYSVVNMDININSINTTAQFGSLERGSNLILKLINGAIVRLVCNHTDRGKANPSDGTTTYNTQFVIDRTAESKLQKYEVDKIRLVWSTGFDEFDIVNMDFFINQLRSLN